MKLMTRSMRSANRPKRRCARKVRRRANSYLDALRSGGDAPLGFGKSNRFQTDQARRLMRPRDSQFISVIRRTGLRPSTVVDIGLTVTI